MKYEPWKQLLTKWKVEKPSVVLAVSGTQQNICHAANPCIHQIGPFVDSTHPSVKNGDVDMTPLAQLRSSILEPLQQLLDVLPGTSALVVPSVRDLVSDHAVFPQADLGANIIDDPVGILSDVNQPNLVLTKFLVANLLPPESLPVLSERRTLRSLERRRPLPPPQGRIL
jgi:DNA polymerase alpha subunit B